MTYRIHQIPGRVRIRTPLLKGHRARADGARAALMSLDGVEHVEVRPLTGSILVYFSPERVDLPEIFHTLANRGFLFRRRRRLTPPRLKLVPTAG